MSGGGELFRQIKDALRAQRERYEAEVQSSRPFQDALHYLDSITWHFLLGLTSVRLQAMRFRGEEDYLLFRFAPHLVETALVIQLAAKKGLQNSARRELRFLLEATVKLSVRDFREDATGLEERLAGLGDRQQRFEDYVAELTYFDEFEKPEEINAEILSLYAELSGYVHASLPQFAASMKRTAHGEPAGMESVATFNRFNKLAFRAYDIVLVRVFHGIGLSMAGDIFTVMLDDYVAWRYHKGKFVSRMSRCFDYKAERKTRD